MEFLMLGLKIENWENEVFLWSWLLGILDGVLWNKKLVVYEVVFVWFYILLLGGLNSLLGSCFIVVGVLYVFWGFELVGFFV